MNIRLLAKKVWLRQILLLLGIVTITAFISWLVAKSILIGGLISLLPSVYFGLMSFRRTNDKSVISILHNMHRGEVGKFILTSAGFAVAFVALKPFDIIALFLSFCMMMLINVVMLNRLK